MHTVPRRHRQGAPVDAAEAVGRPSAARAIAGDGGRVDLRSWPGRTQSGAYGIEILSRRSEVCTECRSLRSLSERERTCYAVRTRRFSRSREQHGVEIPRLCYMEGMRPDGNCRTCMVEIKGERVLAPSCCRFPKEGMEVTTNSERALISQKMSIELLLSDVPETSYTLNSELDLWAKKLSIGKPRFAARPSAARGPLASRNGSASRCLHPVQSLRARVPRRTGQ